MAGGIRPDRPLSGGVLPNWGIRYRPGAGALPDVSNLGRRGWRARAQSENVFSKRLADQGFSSRHTMKGSTYAGIGLLTEG